LDQVNQQNLWTAIAPQAMLYGTLLQAQGYLKALDKLSMWKGYYTDALAALKKEDNSRRIDRNTTVQEP
jgi:2-C-methyl-D-erythritol 4-phosphate cytidylyltransferase